MQTELGSNRCKLAPLDGIYPVFSVVKTYLHNHIKLVPRHFVLNLLKPDVILDSMNYQLSRIFLSDRKIYLHI
uniref:Uncharacterized protein n=1 Tax=Aegilops tauschii subsp. strangulata TaxID=200361 RepID=A0A453IUB9_AEGTS